LPDAQRAESQAGRIGAIEDVVQRNASVFAVCTIDHRAPPAASGKQCGPRRRQQRHRTTNRQYEACVRQSMYDDRWILIAAH
jgi:hypothetical protein